MSNQYKLFNEGEREMSRKIKCAVAAAVLATSFVSLAGAQTLKRPTAGLAASGACSPTATQFRTSQLQVSNTNGLKPIKESSISFVQGGGIASCVIVTFSSEARTDDKTVTMFVAAQLDGSQLAEPGEVFFAAQSAFQSRSFTFVFPNVSPGRHAVKMLFERSGNPGTAVAWFRTLVVQHAP
jgi:hypothetical protein